MSKLLVNLRSRWHVLVALPLLVAMTACGPGAGSAHDATIPSAELQLRHHEIDGIVAKLRPHGLVYDLNRKVKVNGKTVTLKLLAIDRDIVFLEFGEDRAPSFMFDLLERNDAASPAGLHPIAGPSPVYTAFNSGVDPTVSGVTLLIRRLNGGPTSAGRIQIPVDLSALKQLPQPRQPTGAVTNNGMRFDVSQFRSGFAVTSVELHGTIVNKSDLYFVPRPGLGTPQPAADPSIAFNGIWSLGVSSPGSQLRFFQMSAGQFDPEGWHATIQLLDMPTHGQLELRLDWISLKGFQSASDQQVAKGPWDLNVDIPQSP